MYVHLYVRVNVCVFVCVCERSVKTVSIHTHSNTQPDKYGELTFDENPKKPMCSCSLLFFVVCLFRGLYKFNEASSNGIASFLLKHYLLGFIRGKKTVSLIEQKPAEKFEYFCLPPI